MKKFMDWCCDEEKVAHFYETTVFRKMDLASLDLRNACENMYMHACGLDSEYDEYAYRGIAESNMTMVKFDLDVVWDWYGDYRDWCEEEDLDCQDLQDIAADSKYMGFPYGSLDYVLMIMHRLYEKVGDL